MLRAIVKKFFTIVNNLFFRVEYVNAEKLPLKGPAIIVANHQHIFDVSVIHCKSKPWVNWVAKKELADIPFLGRIVLKMGTMPVDRNKSDFSVAKSMFEKIKNKEVIALFPQGTRVMTSEQMATTIPKTGAVHIAIRTNTPLIPVGILGNFKLFSKVKVVVGDPIDFSNVPKDKIDADELMKLTVDVMTKIYELIGIEYNLKTDSGNNEKI